MKLNHNFLRACLLAASKDQTRIYLTGVLVKWEKDKTTYVGTDGHRLHMIEEKAENGNEVAQEFILPPGLIPQLSHLLPNARNRSKYAGDLGSQIECDVKDTKLTFTACTNDPLISGFSSQAINATYPDYTRVLPKKIEDLKDGEVLGFNWSFMNDAQNAFAILSGMQKHIIGLALQYGGAAAPAKMVRDFDSNKFTAVVMPMRV